MEYSLVSSERAYSQLYLAYLIEHVDLGEDLNEDAQMEVYSNFQSEYGERTSALAFYHRGYANALQEVIGLIRGAAGPIGTPGTDKFVGMYNDVSDLSDLTGREKATLKRLMQRSSADLHEVVKALRKRNWT